MKIALCNEVLRELPFDAQCRYAAELGYDGLEVAPFTLAEEPHRLPASDRRRLRRVAGDAGIQIIGLHWLLVTPAGLSLNGRDAAARARTVDVMRALVALCADLGGAVMVHGSPVQRQVADDDRHDDAWKRAREAFVAVASDAEAAGIAYCIEPLAARETNFINTVDEAARMVAEVGSPAVRTMIDTSAAAVSEPMALPEVLDRWLPTGVIAHIQVNDRNRRGPGQGTDRFATVFAALARHHYDRVVSVEPFEYRPDGLATAARAIGYIRGIQEALPRGSGR